MPLITVGTIGFEEVRDLDRSVDGRLWIIVLIISGVAVLGYATTSLVALAVEGTVRDYSRSRRMRAEISKLHGHHVLCGYGRVERHLATEFASQGFPFAVDQDPLIVEECLSEGCQTLFG
jgi:voltage-gated potassium channel